MIPSYYLRCTNYTLLFYYLIRQYKFKIHIFANRNKSIVGEEGNCVPPNFDARSYVVKCLGKIKRL